ncbi:hypothetical protein Tco_0862265 [Tanacetum coccineum]
MFSSIRNYEVPELPMLHDVSGEGILRLQALISSANDTASLIKVVSVAQIVYAANMKSLVARDLGSTRYVSAAYVHVSAVNEDKKGILRLQALISSANDTASLIKVVSVAQIVYAANMKVNTARA